MKREKNAKNDGTESINAHNECIRMTRCYGSIVCQFDETKSCAHVPKAAIEKDAYDKQ